MFNQTNKKRFLLSFIIISLLSMPGVLRAQQSKFQIQDYIPEMFKDIELRLTSSISLQGNENEYSKDLDPYYTYDARNNLSKYHRQDVHVSCYSRYRYETVPKYLIAGINVGGGYYNNKNESSERIQIDADNSLYSKSVSPYSREELFLNPEVDAGLYFTDNMFLSSLSWFDFDYTNYPKNDRDSYGENVGPVTGGFIETDINDNKYRTDRDEKSYSFDINILPGYGHVYEGRFASAAIYIIEELRNSNLLSKEPTDQQMIELSELLYQAKSEHYFDYRLHDIETIEKISDFLESKEIIGAGGFRTALTINDVWKYFPNYSRQFGFKFRAGLGIMYRHSTVNLDSRTTNFDFTTRYHPDSADVIDTLTNSTYSSGSEGVKKSAMKYPYATAMFDYYKPVNHRWQVNFSALMRLYFGAGQTGKDSTQNINSDNYSMNEREIKFNEAFRFNLSSTALYILNSRTSGTLSAGLGYSHFKQKMTLNETNYEFNAFKDWNYFANMSLTYRISIPVTWTISATYASGPEMESVMGAYEDQNYNMYYIYTYLNYNIL